MLSAVNLCSITFGDVVGTFVIGLLLGAIILRLVQAGVAKR